MKASTSAIVVIATSMMVMSGCTILEGLERSLKATPATVRFCSDPKNIDEDSTYGMSRSSCLLHLNNEVEQCKKQMAGTDEAIQACAEARFRAKVIPEGG